jgi:glutathione S-transferase
MVRLVITEPGRSSALREEIDRRSPLPQMLFQTTDAFISLARSSSIGLAPACRRSRALVAEHPASCRFCYGESPTVADICLVTQATPAMTFNLPLEPYPRVIRVYDTCMAIPAFADAHPAKQPDAE